MLDRHLLPTARASLICAVRTFQCRVREDAPNGESNPAAMIGVPPFAVNHSAASRALHGFALASRCSPKRIAPVRTADTAIQAMILILLLSLLLATAENVSDPHDIPNNRQMLSTPRLTDTGHAGASYLFRFNRRARMVERPSAA